MQKSKERGEKVASNILKKSQDEKCVIKYVTGLTKGGGVVEI